MKRLLLILCLISSVASGQSLSGKHYADVTTFALKTGTLATLKTAAGGSYPFTAVVSFPGTPNEIVTFVSSTKPDTANVIRGVGNTIAQEFPGGATLTVHNTPIYNSGVATLPSQIQTTTAPVTAGMLPPVDASTKLTGVVPAANGGSAIGTAAMSATTGTVTLALTTFETTVTPTGAMTWNFSAGTVIGQIRAIKVTTSGVTSFAMTPGTGVRGVAFNTGATTAKKFTLLYYWDGTVWQQMYVPVAM